MQDAENSFTKNRLKLNEQKTITALLNVVKPFTLSLASGAVKGLWLQGMVLVVIFKDSAQ